MFLLPAERAATTVLARYSIRFHTAAGSASSRRGTSTGIGGSTMPCRHKKSPMKSSGTANASARLFEHTDGEAQQRTPE
ncbi:hypothetical protein CSUI_005092 [Cystoisospora suis]|uniref:Uncharacterized protein n=1 Tax=Cystoisospora suis TaxID=483139 RepID=A0A2C6KYA1_9APIC|nr:hypothetical protein CSUI_005092 [Cystoisospora suis]